MARYCAALGTRRRRVVGIQPSSRRLEDTELKSADGVTILIGRNNLQNDHLTLHLAAPNDIWLNARGFPGAHVVIRAAGRFRRVPCGRRPAWRRALPGVGTTLAFRWITPGSNT